MPRITDGKRRRKRSPWCEWLRVEDLPFSTTHTYSLCAEGKLTSALVDGIRLISRESLETLIEEAAKKGSQLKKKSEPEAK
jgi:hypothetical protein